MSIGKLRRWGGMVRSSLTRIVLMLAVAATVITSQALTFSVTVDGEAAIRRAGSDAVEQISGETSVEIGDTLFAADDDIAIQIESGSRLLIKSGTVVALGGQSGALDAALEDGQVFLDRNPPHELASVRVLTRGFVFTPVGTAAAVKTTPQGAPTVAVLRGAMQMQNARGETMRVGARQFGTVNASGQFASGDLNERGLAQLESWSGVKAEEKPAPAMPPPPEKPLTPAPPIGTIPPETAQPPSQLSPQTDTGDPEPDLPKTAAISDKENDKDADKKAPAGPSPVFSKPDFELSAGMATVNGQPWTRLALGIDIPIWKFGVFLDLELFIDQEGNLSNKGWDFKDNAADAFFRKIRYIRYGRENEPLFIKFGGLSNVTLGYGIIMDRFTNMLNYPEEKLLGLQFYLNDISSAGVTLQTLVSDFAEVGDEGGIYAARLAVKPLKTMEIPIISGLSVGGTYAHDQNTYAPARKWPLSNDEELLLEIRDQEWYNEYKDLYEKHNPGRLDDVYKRLDDEKAIRTTTRSFGIWGIDAGLPIINTSVLGVTLYGQYADRADSVKGWGIGAPGVAFNILKLNGNVEYRKIEGRFTPGFFDTYYLDERFSRASLRDKSQYLDSVSLNGVYGRLGMDVYGLLKLDGAYQYMMGKGESEKQLKDQRYEATVGLGGAVMNYIPKINRAEVYVRNTHIGTSGNVKYDTNDEATEKLAGFFDRTPFMYWGYRAGFEITPGATLVWDYRYGWTVRDGKLASDNRMFLQTALRF